MQLFVALVVLFSPFLASASASGYSRSVARAHKKISVLDTSTICGAWDSKPAGPYSLCNDHWGSSGATGEQCSQLISINGSDVAWKTTYTWPEGWNIKSFTNIQLNKGLNQQLSAIKKMPTKWQWHMSSTSVMADVAYDLFTADHPGGQNRNEVMIWLGNYNTGPIAYAYTPEGNAVSVASEISLEGHIWSLFLGFNGYNKVFSFLPPRGSEIKTFQGDLRPFFTYLIENQGLSETQYLVTAQAGSEATKGSSTLTTTKFSLAIN